jgi:DNA primase
LGKEFDVEDWGVGNYSPRILMTSILETLISEDFTLTNSGKRYAKTLQHDSLVLDRKKDIFYWNSKNIIGNAFTYLIKIRGYDKSQAIERLKDSKDTFSWGYADEKDTSENVIQYSPLVEIFYEYGKKFGNYWHDKRGYSDNTIAEFKLGYTGTWYTIPIFEHGEFVNFQARMENPKIIKHWYKGIGPHSFNFSILKLVDWVVITEGPNDAIMLRQNNIPAVSQTGGAGFWNREWNPLFSTKKKIYVVYDNDDAGKFHAQKVAQQWGRARYYNFDTYSDKYDITNYFKDGGTKEEFMELLTKESKND